MTMKKMLYKLCMSRQGTRSASVTVQKGLQCKKMFQGRGLAADITAVKRNSRGFTHSVHTNL